MVSPCLRSGCRPAGVLDAVLHGVLDAHGEAGGDGAGDLVKGGEKAYTCGGGIVYHRHDEKELNREPGRG